MVTELVRSMVRSTTASVQVGTCSKTPEPPQASHRFLVEAQPAQQQLLTRETATELLNDRRAVQLARTGAGWTIWPSRHDGNS